MKSQILLISTIPLTHTIAVCGECIVFEQRFSQPKTLHKRFSVQLAPIENRQVWEELQMWTN